MPPIPTAQLLGVDYEPGFARYDVLCPYCQRVHHHQWQGVDTVFAVIAPCSGVLRYRVRMRRRDDQALDIPVPNWTE
jgi:hypothetical protein